jgi:CMP-N-acetylneuraminic acid synthetase
MARRSQDLEPAFHDAGQFYWGRWEAWAEGREVLTGDTSALVLPDHLVHDIDEPGDWARAEMVFRSLTEVAGS